MTGSRRYLGADPAITNLPVTGQVFSYDYDQIGNRLFASNSAQKTTYGANSLDQYTAATNPAQSFAYDDDGNMTNWISGTNRLTYVWDAENRLVAVISNGVTVVSNRYDYMSRRVAKVTGTGTNCFVYDGWNLIAELGTWNLQPGTNYYVWGQDLSQSLQGAGGVGGLLALHSSSASNSSYFPFFDANGNVTELVNTNGALAAHYEYDPYGNSIKATGTFASNNAYRFSTKYTDDETGLLYFGYRFYCPQLGRWLSRDPIRERGGLNLYLFCRNRVIGLYDRLGTAPGNPDDMPRPPGQGNGDGWTWNPNQNWNPDNPNQRPGNWTDPNGEKWQWDPDPNNNHGGPHWDVDGPNGRRRVDPNGNPLPDDYDETKYEYRTEYVCPPLPTVNPQTTITTITIGELIILLIIVVTFAPVGA